MDLLAAYSDDEDEQQPQQTSSAAAFSTAAAAAASSSSSSSSAAVPSSSNPSSKPSSSSSLRSSLLSIDAAPDVPLDLSTSHYLIAPTQRTLLFNPKVEEMYTPIQGPTLPGRNSTALTTSALGGSRNHQLGFVEPLHMSNAIFEDNYHQFISKGVAVDPAAPVVALEGDGASSKLIFNSNRTTDSIPRINPRLLTGEEKAALRAKRKAANQDPSDLDNWAGPWASRETEEDEALRIVEGRELTEEQKAEVERLKAKKRKAGGPAAAAASGESAEQAAEAEQIALERTMFHGAEERDYQGRTYMTPPSTLEVPDDLSCYLPKRLLHTFTGHTKGVNAIKFLPVTGHLLLSASNDKTVKIWNVVSSAHGGYKCLRTYQGHSEAVRGIDFNHDGTKFMTCSYDKYVKLWDTETGQCIARHSTGKVPLCVRIHPDPSLSNEVLIGQQNKLVVTLDLRSNEIVQTYNEHLGPVNSITFIDENRRFVSSSDDKKLLVWEYGIPVVIKHLAEPDMHSMPYVAVHPSGKFFCGQSQDNQILCFTAINKYKLKRDKRFIGHLTAGYACEIGFSPDGQYIMSGDAQGRVLFWDWKTSKVYKKLKCHDQVTMGVQWNPIETSKIATCSWDGTIKYWD